MTKQHLIELVKRRLGNTGRFRSGVIEHTISEVWQQVIKDLFKNNMHKLDNYTKTYTNVAVQYDSTSEKYYSILPEQIIQTIDTAEGVRRINKLKGNDIDFVPVREMDVSLFKNLDAGIITDSIGYVVKSERVEYYLMTDDISKVRMDLVIPFEKWAIDDEIRLPMGASETIIEEVTGILKGVPYVPREKRVTNQDEREV